MSASGYLPEEERFLLRAVANCDMVFSGGAWTVTDGAARKSASGQARKVLQRRGLIADVRPLSRTMKLTEQGREAIERGEAR